jgi:hypothetical protein
LRWDGTDETAQSYRIERSTDGGLNYTSLATILRDPTGANYDTESRTYAHTDTLGTPGDIYRIIAAGEAGDSDPVIVVSPPELPGFCLLVGYLMDPFGAVDPASSVVISYRQALGDQTTSFGGESGTRPDKVVRLPAERTFYPDDRGYWEAEVLRGTRLHVEIPDANISFDFTVPDEPGPINVLSARELAGKQLSLYQPTVSLPIA